MTLTESTQIPDTTSHGWSFTPPAISQIDAGKAFITSLSASLLIHRVGQVNYGFMDEARSFARDLQKYMNARLNPDATTLVYEEVFGGHGRLHWLVHMKTPGDYRRLLQMVDHDKAFQEIYQGNRLPERGGGNWERIFAQSSFREHVLIPQHGFGNHALEDADPDGFVPAARHQLPPLGELPLDSATAGALILRTVQARYESRDVARHYLYEWQTYVNRAMPGVITSTLFEEIWGSQDQLHLVLHLRSLDDYGRLGAMEVQDAGLRELMGKPRVSVRGEALGWGGLFERASMRDTVLVPLVALAA